MYDDPVREDKEALRQQIAKDVRKFKRAGGTITAAQPRSSQEIIKRCKHPARQQMDLSSEN